MRHCTSCFHVQTSLKSKGFSSGGGSVTGIQLVDVVVVDGLPVKYDENMCYFLANKKNNVDYT